MDTSEKYKYRIDNSPREVTLTLSENDFRALTLWHVSATNSYVNPDFGIFIMHQAMQHLQNKIDDTPQYFQAMMLMLAKDKDPFASDAEVERVTGYSFRPQKRGLFTVKPSLIVWKNLSLGRPLGWFHFRPGWRK
jgi:hypothetical protein